MNRLREERIRTNRTQAEVANELNITQSAYSKYETEKAQPDIESLKKLAGLYDCSIDHLLGKPQPEPEKFATYASALKAELLDIFDTLKQYQQSEVVSFAQYVKQKGAPISGADTTKKQLANDH